MRLRLLGVAAVAAGLVLAGCSSDSDDAASSASPTAESPSAEAGTIVEVAAAAPDYSTLVAAVEAAGLVETLNDDGPFTVFAPNNAAFEALPAGVLDALLLPENQDALVKVLTYHVVPGVVTSEAVTDGEVATVEGQTVTLSTANGVQVNGATVIAPDIVASNGVIHGIDAVLIPPDVDPAALVG